MDWSTALTATGPAAVTGLLGYYGARFQARVTLRQAEVTLEQVRVQHDEDHLRHRQHTYHDLLDCIRRVDMIMTLNIPPGSAIDDQEVLNQHEHLLNGAALYGTAEVREAAENLSSLVSSRADDQSVSDFDRWRAIRPEYRTAFGRLVDEMRADVAPGSRPHQVPTAR